jgi:hypothetical protein
MPRKEFESFTRLDASDVNTFLMDQSVQTFAGTAARGSAIATPVEGMVTYLNDIDSLSVYNGTAFTTDRTIQVFAGTAARGSAIGTAVEGMYTHINDTDSLEFYDGSAWVAAGGGGGAILQVIQTIKTDTFTVASGASFVSITGLSATITPASASNKILVIANVQYGLGNIANIGTFRLYGGNTNTYIGDSASTRTRGVFGGGFAPDGSAILLSGSISYLDSPATTSAITYGVEVKPDTSTFVNRSVGDSDETARTRGASSIILMEVAA